MALSGFVLGVINIAITVAVLLLVGVLIKWVWDKFLGGTPAQAQQLYLAVVALVALYLLVALLFGLPSAGFIHLR